MSLLPVFLKLDAKPALVVGAGEVAAGKIESLVASGARVTVVAPWARPEIVRLHERGSTVWHAREFANEDLSGQFVVVAGTNHAHVNQHVYRLCAERGILCNAVDDPPHCDFYYGSVVSRGDLQIAISTAGESPAVAQRLRKELDAALPLDLGPWLHSLGGLRREVLAAYPASDARKSLLQMLGSRQVCELEGCPSRRLALPHLHAQALLNPVKAAGAEAERAPQRDTQVRPEGGQSTEVGIGPVHWTAKDRPSTVMLVGAGPGDPDLLTVKAARLLAGADLLLHDDLVPEAVVSLAPKTAEVVSVGKRCGRAAVTQQEIHERMIAGARAGRSVVRLKSGDPLLFGRAGEEMDALRAAGIPFVVVPGVTAVSAAASSLPCSLTDRRAASSVLLSTGHHAPGEGLHAEPTRAVYMPGRDLSAIAYEWRKEGLPGDYPCVLVSHAGQPGQQVTRTTLSLLHVTAPGPAPMLLLGGEVFRQAQPAADLESVPVWKEEQRPTAEL